MNFNALLLNIKTATIIEQYMCHIYGDQCKINFNKRYDFRLECSGLRLLYTQILLFY